MSVFHKTMVWLGLVDDDEYYGDDDEYYADEYGDPVSAPTARRAPARATTTAPAPAPPQTEPSPLTVIRSRRERDEPARRARHRCARAAVKPIPMPATRVHVMDPQGLQRRAGSRRPPEGGPARDPQPAGRRP